MRSESETTRTTPRPEWDPLAGRWTEPRLLPEATNGRGKSSASTLRTGIIGGIVGALVATAILIPLSRRDGSTIVEPRLAPSSATSVRPSVVDIAAKATPWVVNLNTRRPTAFAGVRRGTGSGVILRSDGYILTSAHVVRDTGSIEVTLASGDKLKARIAGIDNETDVAVIKVDRQRLPAAVIGTVKKLRVGDVAIAIGSPLGLEQTVTEGIISALGRTVRPDSSSPPLVEMIQTDAPITHGNSGGALVNGDGAVIGINTAIATRAGVSEGIAFATPIDVAVAVAHELIATGRATHPWLGVTGANITSETAEKFRVDEGAFIMQIFPGSPASRVGIRPDDVVVKFDRERIESMDDLVVAIRNHKVGQRVALELVRRGRHITVHPTLAEKPPSR